MKTNLASPASDRSSSPLRLILYMSLFLALFAGGLTLTTKSSPPVSSVNSLLAAPFGAPGSDPAHLNPVFLFQFMGTGALASLPSIPSFPASSVNDPIFVEFNAEGELFVANRHGNIGGGVGSISRFTFDASGNFFANGTITGNSLEKVHGLAFSPEGELFAANFTNSLISRFLFDPSGNAVANGTISSPGTNMGLAFSSSGELFVTRSDNLVDRFIFDSMTGAAIPNGSFIVPGASALHGMTFSDSGELFLCDIGTNRVFRYLFDGAGNAIANGDIFVLGGPIGADFSADGELFVSLHFSGGISRFLFDPSGNPIANGFTPTDTLGGLAIFSGGCSEAPTISQVSANPATLWPPNHKMIDVTINYDVTDDCDQSSAIACTLGVTSNEPIEGTGDGDTAPDWEIVDAHHVRLRAERAGNGNGRIYTITITCVDSGGNSSSQTVTVSVPINSH